MIFLSPPGALPRLPALRTASPEYHRKELCGVRRLAGRLREGLSHFLHDELCQLIATLDHQLERTPQNDARS